MKARVAFPFVGDTVGGSHISASILMAALPKHGYEPVALVHRHGPLEPFLVRRNLPITRIDLPFLQSGAGGVSALARMAAMAPYLASALRRHHIDIVHANDGGMISTWMPAARFARCKAIAHRRTRWGESRLAHLSLRLAHKIITISQFTYASLPVDLRRRATIIDNPFEANPSDRVAGRLAAVAACGNDGPIVAFVGTLQRQKRPLVFLKAAAMIHRARADVRFLMIGRDGQEAERVRETCVALGLAQVVTVVGFRADVQLLLSGCDLLLAPAVDEGHGRSLIEAMLSSVPVIASASGGHIEATRNGEVGLLVPAEDHEALAKVALDLLAVPSRARERTVAAEAWALTAFSPDGHAAAVAGIYDAVLAR